LNERVTRMPLPRIGDTTVFPSPRFNLTPFGSEQYLDVFLENEGHFVDLYGRVGTSDLATYWGAGARVLGLEVGRRFTLGGEVDIWQQPQILFDVRGANADQLPSRFGMNSGLYGDLYLAGDVSVTGKLAVKTPGYVMAQPVDGGVYGYVGASIAWR
jgi:hypothetical protein